MQLLAHTYHVAEGVPPRRYAVTFELHGERRVHVACDNGPSLLLQWHGGSYRPGSRAFLTAAIAKYLLIAARDSRLEQTNAQLLQESGVRSRAPGVSRNHNGHERQLPVGDRS